MPTSGVIAVVRREERYLVIRRSTTVRAPLAFCFPGGGVESGESEHEALVREMHEELGVAVSVGARLWQNATPEGIPLAWFDVRIDSWDSLMPNAGEVKSIHWADGPSLRYLPGLLGTNVGFLEAVRRGEVRLPEG